MERSYIIKEINMKPYMKPYMGTIQEWRLVKVAEPNGYAAVGYIYDSPKWIEGSRIRTSLVVERSKSQIETLNSIYKLGKMF